MPHRTAGEKRLVIIANVFVLVVLAVLMFAIMRAWKERRRVAREWKSNQP